MVSVRFSFGALSIASLSLSLSHLFVGRFLFFLALRLSLFRVDSVNKETRLLAVDESMRIRSLNQQRRSTPSNSLKLGKTR